MSEIVVRPVDTYQRMGHFIEVPWLVYKDDPNWVPPLRLERRFHYSRFNPFFEHAEWQAWVAYKDNHAVGRISAQIDSLHRQHYGQQTGHFGTLECINDEAVFATLIDSAEQWLIEHDAFNITGPFNLSINQECGVLVEGFDTPPVVMMPHSRKWYDSLLQQYGYQSARDLLAYWVDVDFTAPKAMQAVNQRYRDQIKLRTLRRKHFNEEMETLRDIFNDAWSENWGFVPFTKAEFSELGNSLRWLVPEDYIQIAELEGRPVAFMAGIPNLNEIFSQLNGSLFPFGWIRLIKLLKSRAIKTGRIPLMGVRKQYQKTPIGLALAFAVIDAPRQIGIRQGIKAVEMSWILEDNSPMRSILKSIGSKEYKRYRLYEKTLIA